MGAAATFTLKPVPLWAHLLQAGCHVTKREDVLECQPPQPLKIAEVPDIGSVGYDLSMGYDWHRVGGVVPKC